MIGEGCVLRRSTRALAPVDRTFVCGKAYGARPASCAGPTAFGGRNGLGRSPVWQSTFQSDAEALDVAGGYWPMCPRHGRDGGLVDRRRFDCQLAWPTGLRREVGEPLLRLRHDPDIGLRRFPALRIDRLGLVVADGAGDDDIVALFPVGRGGDAMLCSHLQ
jgi:hypothetical protein